jgi:membrane protein DedA with SNARE-associated domain
MPYQDYSYLVILVILFACAFGLPIPEDITLVVGGILAAYNITNFWYTVIICMFGVLCGDCIIYLLGRFLGSKILKSRFLSKMIKARHLARVRLASHKYGNFLIFFARFMPGVRTPIYFSIGMFKKPFYVFLSIDGIASIISVPVWVYVGMFFGDNIPALEHHVKQMEHGIYILLAVLIVVIILFYLLKKKFVSYLFNKAKLEE